MSSLQSRLRQAFDPRVHSQSELAKAARVKPPSVADWFNGKTKSLKAEPLVRAAMYLAVRPLWLAAGDGPMRDDPSSWAPTAREPAPTYTRPAWPFPGLDEGAIASLDRDTVLRIEGAVVVAAQSLGVDLGNRRAA